MAEEKNKAVPAAYLVLKKDDKILLARRFNTGYYDNYYSLPAGHIEAGELPIDTLVREIKEEIGIEIDKSNVRLAHIMYRTKQNETGDRVDFFFTTSTYQGTITNMELDKCDDIQWFPINQLPENIIPYIQEAINNIKKKVIYSELGVE